MKKKVKELKDKIVTYEKTREELNQKINETRTDGFITDIIIVTKSFSKYGLITLGKNSDITSQLKAGNEICVKYGEKEYTGKVHKSVPGRIDGLTSMYRENVDLIENSTMEITYHKAASYIIVN